MKARLSEHTSMLEALNEMSGQLIGELQAIHFHLVDHIQQCNQSIITELRKRFKSIPEAAVLIQQLDSLSPKAHMPHSPDIQANWGWTEWAHWATLEYLPYRSWQQRFEITVTELEKYSANFENWLFAHYPKLKHETKTPLVHGTHKRISEVIDEGNIVLWVIVDNLDWQNAMSLVKYMNRESMFLTSNPEPKLSMLPSETYTSKRALVGGQLPCDILEGLDYEGLLSSRWGEGFAKLARNCSTLTQLVADEASLYVYMFDELDKIAHATWIDRESLIQHTLSWLTSKIKEAATILATKGRLRIIVSSDHGSIKLPANSIKATKPAYAKLDEEHARFAGIRDMKHLSPGQWYFLEKTAFGLKENYAVPKGNVYIETKPLGLTHGGLSPEETIVAHLEFGLEPPLWYPLILVYRGAPLRLGRDEIVKLSLINRNKVSISQVRIQLLSQNLETELQKVPPESDCNTDEIQINIPPRTMVSDSNEVKLEAKIWFNAFGEARYEDITVRLPVIRMWKEVTKIDLFGENK